MAETIKKVQYFYPEVADKPGQGGCLGLILLLAGILAGCSSSLSAQNFGAQRTVDVRELYRDPAFSRQDLERQGVTCLPARLSFGHETYGHVLVQGLVETLQTELAGKGIVHPNLAASHINEAGLAEDYATMLTAYDRTNILNRTTLRHVGRAVGVGYFAVPILLNFHEKENTRLSVFGLRLAKTSRVTARFQLQFWDARSGGIVWEGLSDLTLAQEILRERPVHLEDAIRATWESLIKEIPSGAVAPAQAEGER